MKIFSNNTSLWKGYNPISKKVTPPFFIVLSFFEEFLNPSCQDQPIV